MNKTKDWYKIAKACDLFDFIYQYILIMFVVSIASVLLNEKWNFSPFLPMILIFLNFIVGYIIEAKISARYMFLASVPYKVEDLIKDMFSFIEIIIFSTFIFDIILNFSFGKIDVALAHLAGLFICLMCNYIIVTFTSENQMKMLNTQTKKIILTILCYFATLAIAMCLIILPYEQAGNMVLRYIYLVVAIVFALCDIIFRKAFINKTLKKIRG